MKNLFILNDPPYDTERCYNGLRLASALVKNDPSTEITDAERQPFRPAS